MPSGRTQPDSVCIGLNGDHFLMEEVRSALSGSSLAVMLYGSRARGVARPNSDVDVLQLVVSHPGSYSKGRVNVAAYTPEHLALLARRGSLFVRHLRDEGLVLEDPAGALARILADYRPPADYAALERELAVIFAAALAVDAEDFSPGLIRLALYSARTAVYIRAAELDRFIFDAEKACVACGIPELAVLLRSNSIRSAQQAASVAATLIGASAPADMPADLASAAVWAWDRFPMAAMLLEAVVAGQAEIDYTSLTVPLA